MSEREKQMAENLAKACELLPDDKKEFLLQGRELRAPGPRPGSGGPAGGHYAAGEEPAVRQILGAEQLDDLIGG